MKKVDNNISAANAAWTFDGIADEFEDHVAKSVPFFTEGHNLICRLSDFFLPSDSLVYDLGTSTGLLPRRILEWRKQQESLRVIGIDCVESMIDKANKLAADDPRATFLCEDLVTFEFEPCELVTSYYCTQFIHPRHRQDLISRIYEALKWGGAFLMFEKVRSPDARFQEYMSQIYQDLKIDMGFSEEEVVNKSRSLKGVLEPFSSAGNEDLLARAGFVDVMTVYKWANWQGWLAIK